MQSLLAGLAHHAYLAVFCAVLAEAVGLPIPAAIALIVAGSTLNPLAAIPLAISAMVLGDSLMFLIGRHTGWWLLSVLCRLSMNPESCILRSADSFYKRGRVLLIFAKFMPGINTLAPPLAGSMRMPPLQFFALDAAGAALYISTYFFVGFIFSSFITKITGAYETLGHYITWLLAAVIIGYGIIQVRLRYKLRELRTVPRVSPKDVPRDDNAAVYDVRSHGYYEPNAMRIEGSERMEPNALNQLADMLPKDCNLYLYCTCYGEATSVRVAHALRQKGVQCSVIRGGLKAWREAGLPIETVPDGELIQLPSFAVK